MSISKKSIKRINHMTQPQTAALEAVLSFTQASDKYQPASNQVKVRSNMTQKIPDYLL